MYFQNTIFCNIHEICCVYEQSLLYFHRKFWTVSAMSGSNHFVSVQYYINNEKLLKINNIFKIYTNNDFSIAIKDYCLQTIVVT